MKNKICGIYKITNPKGKIYIGQSVDIMSRWSRYKNLHTKGQALIDASLKKYGVEKHKFEVVHECEREKLNELEKYYVDLFKSFNSKFGLNLKDGGGHGTEISDETKEKLRQIGRVRVFTEQHRKRISEAKKGYKHSEEAIYKIKLARSKQVSPMKGNKHSEATKEKIRKTKTGVRMPEEQRQRLIVYLTGRPSKTKGRKASEESRKRMSVAQRGLKKKPHSAETKLKMSNSHKLRQQNKTI